MQMTCIPLPAAYHYREGSCVLEGASRITWRGLGVDEVAELLAEYLRPATGFAWPVEAGEGGTIALEAAGAGVPDDAGFVDERYRLGMHRDGVRLAAANATGLARGIHLHLTEDQGWRLEIKKYPLLTETGARRACTLMGHESDRPRRYDGIPYGGYYTQADSRRIVAFAARRHVTIVPEIDMPGHMGAAIAAYPELGNLPFCPPVRCHWGISQHVLNVEETTVAFMQDVLDEVMELFPSRFIHIGGDEVPKHEWRESMRAQARMAELGLASENALQSWFIRRMDAHLRVAGRRLIGWDEILEGGLAEGAAVMSWRGEAGGLEAARLGHDVVMAPGEWVYFDHYQAVPEADEPLAIGGLNTTERVYDYAPAPAALEADLHPRVLGAQGQLWTEYIPTVEHLDYTGFPRICALAETLWLAAERKDPAGFLDRLQAHRARLTSLGVNAHPSP